MEVKSRARGRERGARREIKSSAFTFETVRIARGAWVFHPLFSTQTSTVATLQCIPNVLDTVLTYVVSHSTAHLTFRGSAWTRQMASRCPRTPRRSR